jgi:hypothetical protein
MINPTKLSVPKEPRKARRINIELLLGLSATFLSFAALIVAIFQTKIAREQQHAAVWPYLSTTLSNSERSYTYNVNNFGIGPAIIKKVSWQLGDSIYSNTFDFIRNEIGFPKGLGRSEMKQGHVLTANSGLSLIEVNGNDSLTQVMEKILTSNAFSLQIIYSDVYGNCWELKEGETKPLPGCPD